MAFHNLIGLCIMWLHHICWLRVKTPSFVGKKNGLKDAQQVHLLETVGSSIATDLERTIRLVAALTNWVDQQRLVRYTPHVAKWLRPLPSGNKDACTSKAHNGGVIVSFVGSLLAVTDQSVRWFRSNTMTIASRARTEVLARSLLHCWALSLLVSCAQRPGTMTVSPALTKRSTMCRTRCWMRWSNVVLPRRHGGSQTGAWTSCRCPKCGQTSRQQLSVLFGWSTKEDEVRKASLGAKLSNDKTSVPASLKLRYFLWYTPPLAAMASPAVDFQLQEPGVKLQLEG